MSHQRRGNLSKVILGVLLVSFLVFGMGLSVWAAKPFEGITLVVSRWAGDPFESATRVLADRFEEETGCKIIIDAVPWENLREKQIFEMASGTGAYDILYIHPFWYAEMVNAGFLLELDDYLTEEEKGLYVSSLLDACRVDGRLYGIPDWIATIILAYRTVLLEEAGLDVPESWEDVLEVAKHFTGDGNYGIALPAKRTGALADIFSTLLPGAGAWYLDETGKPNINTPEAIETAAFVAEMLKYAPPGVLNFHWDEAGNAAMQGKVALMVAQSVNSSWLNDPNRSTTAGKWGFTSFKYNGKPTGLVQNYAWSVASDTQHPEAAIAFIRWLSETEQQRYLAEATGTAGAMYSFYEDEELISSMPFLTAMLEAFTNAMPQPSWPQWAEMQETLELSLQNIYLGNEEPAEAMQKLQAVMEELF